jgi:hypothetical protein
MLVSVKHRILFVHIPKVAGMSIVGALRPVIWPMTRVTDWINRWEQKISRSLGITKKAPMFEESFPISLEHLRARDWRDKLTKPVFDQLFKFAFVRNPWDWQVSLYHYMLQNTKHFHHEVIKSLGSFENYVNSEALHRGLQKDFITDEQGNNIVDFVGRFERIADDFQQLCRLLQLKNVALPHVNASKHVDYRKYYSNKTRDLIEECFREDIDAFGYAFDDAGKKDTAFAEPIAGKVGASVPFRRAA